MTYINHILCLFLISYINHFSYGFTSTMLNNRLLLSLKNQNPFGRKYYEQY